MLFNAVRLSVSNHGNAIQSVSAPPFPLSREAECHSQWNTRYYAASSLGRHMLSIACKALPNSVKCTGPREYGVPISCNVYGLFELNIISSVVTLHFIDTVVVITQHNGIGSTASRKNSRSSEAAHRHQKSDSIRRAFAPWVQRPSATLSGTVGFMPCRVQAATF